MIAIVGGGVSGLAVAWHLARAGVDHVVLEAAEEVGGVVRSEVVEGRVLDLGPQRTRLTPAVREVVQGTGLSDQLLTVPPERPLWIVEGGALRRAPLTVGGFLSTRLLDWRAKLRILVEPFTPPADDAETVEAFFVRKFGREAYRALLGPLYGGLYASDPARMYVRHALRGTLRDAGAEEGSLVLRFLRSAARARRGAPAVSFRRGMAALPRALASAPGVRVRRGATATGLERDGSGWRVSIRDGEPVDARAVVLALPADRAGRLLRPVAPDAARRLEGLRYNPLALVHLRADAGGLDGLGYQVAFDEPLETRGVTWNASLFPGPEAGREGVFTAFLGGMKNPAVVEDDDGRLARTAAHEFTAVTGRPAVPLRVSRTRMPSWDGTWDALADLTLPDGIEACASWESRPGIVGRLREARALAERLA